MTNNMPILKKLTGCHDSGPNAIGSSTKDQSTVLEKEALKP